jgi:hypothetical protein
VAKAWPFPQCLSKARAVQGEFLESLADYRACGTRRSEYAITLDGFAQFDHLQESLRADLSVV